MVRVILFATALLGLATFVRAGDDGFVSLFNGKDLTGWKYYKEDLTGKTATADGRFTVKDGVIVAEEGKGIKDLYTVKDYNANFHLRLEFRAALKADSGVYVRGPQMQVRDFIRRKENLHLKLFKNDDWNALDIQVKHHRQLVKVNGKIAAADDVIEANVSGGKATAKLNGKPFDLGKLEIVRDAAIAHCRINGEFVEDMSVPAKSDKGIGLQAEVGKFEFRNVRIRSME